MQVEELLENFHTEKRNRVKFSDPAALAKAPRVPSDKKPLRAQKRRWNFVEMTPFLMTQDATRLVGQIYGQRSDGQFFCVRMCIWPEEVTEGMLEVTFTEASEKFHSYRDCSCGLIGYEVTEERDEDGAPIRRPVASPCALHGVS